MNEISLVVKNHHLDLTLTGRVYVAGNQYKCNLSLDEIWKYGSDMAVRMVYELDGQMRYTDTTITPVDKSVVLTFPFNVDKITFGIYAQNGIVTDTAVLDVVKSIRDISAFIDRFDEETWREFVTEMKDFKETMGTFKASMETFKTSTEKTMPKINLLEPKRIIFNASASSNDYIYFGKIPKVTNVNDCTVYTFEVRSLSNENMVRLNISTMFVSGSGSGAGSFCHVYLEGNGSNYYQIAIDDDGTHYHIYLGALSKGVIVTPKCIVDLMDCRGKAGLLDKSEKLTGTPVKGKARDSTHTQVYPVVTS